MKGLRVWDFGSFRVFWGGFEGCRAWGLRSWVCTYVWMEVGMCLLLAGVEFHARIMTRQQRRVQDSQNECKIGRGSIRLCKSCDMERIRIM